MGATEKDITKRKVTQRKYLDRPEGKFSCYKSSAKKRNYQFFLTFDQFVELVVSPCHYCNFSGLVGIDRKDNKEGYTLENSLPCCKTCNYAKRDMSYDEFIGHCEKVTKHRRN